MERKNDRLPIFTERFRELQGERSNTEFADFLGISRQTVGFYCNGDRVPDALTLIKISQKCGVSVDWLLGLSTAKTYCAEIAQICNYIGLSPDSVQTLHESYTKQNPCPILFVIDKILNRGRSYRFNRFAWRGAVAEFTWVKVKEKERNEIERSFLGLNWDEYSETDKYREIAARTYNIQSETDKKLLEEARKPIEDTSDTIEIDIHSVSDLYEEKAVNLIMSAVDSAYHKYVDEMMKIGFCEEYEKIVKAVKRIKKPSPEHKRK